MTRLTGSDSDRRVVGKRRRTQPGMSAILGVSPVIVLVVEDDEATRELFATALRAEGFAVVAVGDGLDALTYLDSHKPAAVVLDLGLPRLHGRDVLDEMAAQGLTRQVPVIVVTGQPISGLNTRDFACVLEKPTSPEELIEAVRRCLANVRR